MRDILNRHRASLLALAIAAIGIGFSTQVKGAEQREIKNAIVQFESANPGAGLTGGSELSGTELGGADIGSAQAEVATPQSSSPLQGFYDGFEYTDNYMNRMIGSTFNGLLRFPFALTRDALQLGEQAVISIENAFSDSSNEQLAEQLSVQAMSLETAPVLEQQGEVAPETPFNVRVAQGTTEFVTNLNENIVSGISVAGDAIESGFNTTVNTVSDLATGAYDAVTGLFRSNNNPDVQNVTIQVDNPTTETITVENDNAPRAVPVVEQENETFASENPTNAASVYSQELARGDEGIPAVKESSNETNLAVDISNQVTKTVTKLNENIISGLSVAGNAIENGFNATVNGVGNAATATGNFITEDVPNAINTIIPSKEEVKSFFGLGEKPVEEQQAAPEVQTVENTPVENVAAAPVTPAPEQQVEAAPETPFNVRVAQGTTEFVTNLNKNIVSGISVAGDAIESGFNTTVNTVSDLATGAYDAVTGLFRSNNNPDVQNVTIQVDNPTTETITVENDNAPRAVPVVEQENEAFASENPTNAASVYSQELARGNEGIPTVKESSNETNLAVDISNKTTKIIGEGTRITTEAVRDATKFVTEDVPNAINTIIPSKEDVRNFFGLGEKPVEEQQAAPEVQTVENAPTDAAPVAAPVTPAPEQQVEATPETPFNVRVAQVAGDAVNKTVEGIGNATAATVNFIAEDVPNAINTIIPSKEDIRNFFGLGEKPVEEQQAAPEVQTVENTPVENVAAAPVTPAPEQQVEAAPTTPEKSLGERVSDETTRIISGATTLTVDGLNKAYNSTKEFLVQDVPSTLTKTVDALTPSEETLSKINPVNWFGSKEKPAEKPKFSVPEPASDLELFLRSKGLSEADIQTALQYAQIESRVKAEQVEKKDTSLKNTLKEATQGSEKTTYTLTEKDTSNVNITVDGMIKNKMNIDR